MSDPLGSSSGMQPSLNLQKQQRMERIDVICCEGWAADFCVILWQDTAGPRDMNDETDTASSPRQRHHKAAWDDHSSRSLSRCCLI